MTCLGFPLDASGINLTDKILPETDLDLLDTDKHFFSVYVLLVSKPKHLSIMWLTRKFLFDLQDILKMSS